MKLQGVIILRINDFRKFFNIEEFSMKRREFSTLFSKIDIDSFCDTPEERALCGQIRLWSLGQSPNASLNDSGELVVPNYGAIPLDYLDEVVKEKGNAVKSSERTAIACICLLLGAYCSEKDARYMFEFMSGRPTGNFVSLNRDVSLEQDFPIREDDYRRVVYANMIPDKEFTVTCGRESETLQFGECVVAICTSKGCVTLLPHTAHSDALDARLMIDLSTHQTYLDFPYQKQKGTIENVASFWIESETDLLYTTFDNKVIKAGEARESQTDFSPYFMFRQTYKIFLRNHPNEKVLAVNKDCNNNYKIYPTSKK